MNEVNAISTSEGDKTPPATGCPDAKREGSQAMDSSAAPLPGRSSLTPEWILETLGYSELAQIYTKAKTLSCGERSGPGNDHRELPPPTMPENTIESYGG